MWKVINFTCLLAFSTFENVPWDMKFIKGQANLISHHKNYDSFV